jgi:hypothetical protein
MVWEWYENLELYRLLFFLSKFNLDSNYGTTYMILSFCFESAIKDRPVLW